MKPKISILIPCFNDEEYIENCIESVLNQIYKDWELIILDDCSEDNTYNKALQYKDHQRIRIYRNDTNLGMLENWNMGIDLCSSKYFAKLDADDYWHPEMLSKSIPILDNLPEVAMVFAKYLEIDKYNEPISNIKHQLPDFAKNKSFDCKKLVQLGSDKMLCFDVLRQGLSVMRTIVFDQLGKYRYLITKETQASTDTEFYFRVGCHNKIFQLDETLYYYRKHDQSISSNNTIKSLQPQKLFEVKKVILKYYLDQGIISRTFFNKELRIVQFRYFSFLFSSNRKSGNYFQSLKYLLKNLISMPDKTFLENLHFNRVIIK